jgi:PAB-dependent poly(A)-specific ribonuclease subunit 2
MNFTSKGTREILVAGCQDSMFKIDVEKGVITETVSLEQHITTFRLLIMRSSQLKPTTPS